MYERMRRDPRLIVEHVFNSSIDNYYVVTAASSVSSTQVGDDLGRDIRQGVDAFSPAVPNKTITLEPIASSPIQFDADRKRADGFAVPVLKNRFRELGAIALITFGLCGLGGCGRSQQESSHQSDPQSINDLFAIDTEGILKVSARDPKTGAERSTTVSMSSGLSAEELEAIMQRRRTDQVAPSIPAPEPYCKGVLKVSLETNHSGEGEV